MEDRSAMTSPDWPRIVPEEEPFCEDCGASMEFCECGLPLEDGRADWEYERRRDREMEAEWERIEKERGNK